MTAELSPVHRRPELALIEIREVFGILEFLCREVAKPAIKLDEWHSGSQTHCAQLSHWLAVPATRLVYCRMGWLCASAGVGATATWERKARL